ncbi:MAG TPA: RNA polymerase sigma factor [Vicinamibacteria bacterium]|nr:RNA polymerase sigma factor [Vicinamibacteria bacterium]
MTDVGSGSAGKARDAALPELLDDYGGRIFGLGLKMCGTPQDAEDLVQETFLQAYRKWDQFEGRSQPSTWLYRIASRLCTRRKRRRAGEPKNLASLDVLPSPDEPVVQLGDASLSPEQLVLRRETRDAVDEAIGHLPEAFRLPLFLKELMELSTEEVAEILGIKPATVKTRVHRARLYLAKELRRHLPRVPAPPPDHSRQICLDLLELKQQALDRRSEFPVPQHELCRRCRSLFLTLDLATDTCRRLADGELPPEIRRVILDKVSAEKVRP